MREWRWLAPLLALQGALAWIYFCGGCLKGTVSYQGKPVKEGWVFLFSPEAVHLCPDTRRRVGVIEKGLYRLSGVDPGPYSVRVVAPDPNARGKTIVTRQRLIVDVDYLFNTHDLDLDVMGPAIK